MIEQVLETISESLSKVKGAVGIRGKAWPLLVWLGQRDFCTGAELKHLTARRRQEVNRSLHALLRKGLVEKAGHRTEHNVNWWLSSAGQIAVMDFDREARAFNDLIEREFGSHLPRLYSDLERLRDAFRYGRVTNRLNQALSVPPPRLDLPPDL